MSDVGSDRSVDPSVGDTEDPLRKQSGPTGALVLVATPIGNLGDISQRAIETLRHADLVCCEDTRHTGQLLKKLGIESKRLLSLHEHNEVGRVEGIIDRIVRGELVALVSDAGTPVISDPGERLVASVVAAGLVVSTIPGPSAAIAALSISGLPAERFAFVGFLPRKGRSRDAQLDRIATSATTSILYESPLRVQETLEVLLGSCGLDRNIAIIRELTKLHEEVWRGTLAEAVARVDVERRGEHVIVVGPAKAQPTGSTEDFTAKLGRLIEAGLSIRDAVSALEILLEVPHRVAYKSALGVEPTSK